MEYTWGDLYKKADDAAYGEGVSKAKDEAR